MAVKFLISGVAGAGKTTLIKDLENAVVFSYDHKKFPFKMLHRNIKEMTDNNFAEELLGLIKAYRVAKGAEPNDKSVKPDYVIIDSISTVIEDIEKYCITYYKNFEVWTKYKEALKDVIDTINKIVNVGINVIMITHAQYNEKENKWEDTTKGAFKNKAGGFYSTVNDSINIIVTEGGRLIYTNNAYYLSRTTLHDVPEFYASEDYSLKEHLEKLLSVADEASTFEL